MSRTRDGRHSSRRRTTGSYPAGQATCGHTNDRASIPSMSRPQPLTPPLSTLNLEACTYTWCLHSVREETHTTRSTLNLEPYTYTWCLHSVREETHTTRNTLNLEPCIYTWCLHSVREETHTTRSTLNLEPCTYTWCLHSVREETHTTRSFHLPHHGAHRPSLPPL